ncbi:MAG: Triosephosphate isomerase [Candidatus Berkelbacteria bacterium]|nr:Triosephosphate isomerase [Candidatus Berkelbacteria bacterium]
MRRPLIVGNWKMNTSLADATVLATSIRNAAEDLDVEIVLCPPFVWLIPLAEVLDNAPPNVCLGAQNMHFADKGPLTGEISPLMLKGIAKYVILGHSERRIHFSESDEFINDKMHAALNNNLIPIICVGEHKKMPLDKRERGRPTKTELRSDVLNQLSKALDGVSRNQAEKIVISYEPVWAISKGTVQSRNSADGAYANAVIERLRQTVARKYGEDIAQRVRIIYGGSVSASTINEFIYQPEIDGALVGGASLQAKEFINICRQAGGRE